MSLQSDINRLFWRFKNGTFRPNQNDIDALVRTCEWINREKEGIKNNTLLSKLYILLFQYELGKYEDLHFSQYSLHSQLKKPLEVIITEFQNKLNLIEFIRFCNEQEIEVGDLTKITTEEDVKKIVANQEDYFKLVNGRWSYAQVEKALYNQISEVFNNFKNTP